MPYTLSPAMAVSLAVRGRCFSPGLALTLTRVRVRVRVRSNACGLLLSPPPIGAGHANHSFTIPREAGECVGNFTLAAVPYAPPHHHETCDAAPSPSASQEGSVPVSVAVGLCVACLLAGGGIALLLVRLFGGSGRPGTPHVSTLDTQRPVLRAVAIPSSGSMAGGGSDEGSVAGAGCADGIEAAAVQVKTQQA
jgi:hypothetical protein